MSVTAKISDNSLYILKERYLEPDESVNQMFVRVAANDEDFIRIMANLEFLPNSPTLMNAGTQHEGKSTFSACFKFDVSDSMLEGEDSIIETGRKAAAVAKWGGGVGYYLGDLRAKNSPIRSVHRVACGPIAVLRYYNVIGKELITQGGRRELAQMGILGCDHADLREFIHVKDVDPQALKTFNISVAAHDKFMGAAMGGFPPEKLLWDEITMSAWKSGDPGLYFPDTAEATNPTPWLGKLTGTNPCGEVPLLNNEACNLGSINLSKFVTSNREVNWNKLEETVRITVRFLDNILDRNCFPHPAITAAVDKTRKIGLGVMGWADMLALMHIHYDTKQAVELGRKLMKFINEVGHSESIMLGNAKSAFPADQAGTGRRNATVTCIAPTGSISVLADSSSGIEPHYSLEWSRTLHAGHGDREKVIQERISVWDRLDGFVPKTAMEIPYEWHIQHTAAFQENTDLAVSKTINLPNSATVEDVRSAYKMLWELGCKGGTIFRDGCRSNGEQVLKAKTVVTAANSGSKATIITAGPVVAPESPAKKTSCRQKPNKDRDSKTHHITIGDFDGYIHAGTYPDGRLCEVFITASKEGSTVSGMLDSWAIAISHALQYGDPLEDLVKKYSGMRFEPSGMTGNPAIPICTSIVDYVVRWLDATFGKGKDVTGYKGQELHSGNMCPDCGAPAIFQGGCLTCKERCGYSRCG